MTPFGFTPPNGSDGPNGPDDGSRDGSGDHSGPEDFNEMLKAIQKQMREQFEKLGIPMEGLENMDNLQFMSPENLTAMFSNMPGMPGFGLGPQAATNDPLPLATVRETAKKFVTAQGVAPLSTRDHGVVASAYEIAEIWLNEATTFPSALSPTHASAVNRADWVDLTIAGWHRDIAPLAKGLLEAMTDLLAQAGREQSLSEGEGSQIPLEAIGGLLRTFIGSMVATQLGQSVGSLAATVTGAHDAGLPILDPARPVLIPENIAAWAADLEIPQSEVFIYHALRESAVARLFAHNPWLVSYIQSTITEYGRGIRIDLEAIQRQAEEAMNNFDPNQPMNNQINLNIELNNGIFSPEESPQQKAALEKLETVLALIDGWSDDVVTTAAGDRIPNIEHLRETQRRRRASSTPAQQLFATLLGLEVSPRLTREASAFWKAIREEQSLDKRDGIWAGILPTSDDLKNPSAFISSTEIPDDLSGLL